MGAHRHIPIALIAALPLAVCGDPEPSLVITCPGTVEVGATGELVIEAVGNFRSVRLRLDDPAAAWVDVTGEDLTVDIDSSTTARHAFPVRGMEVGTAEIIVSGQADEGDFLGENRRDFEERCSFTVVAPAGGEEPTPTADATAEPTGEPLPVVDACEVVTAEELSRLVGHTATASSQQSLEGTGTCLLRSPPATALATVRLFATASEAKAIWNDFRSEASGRDDFREVEVGDGAFFSARYHVMLSGRSIVSLAVTPTARPGEEPVDREELATALLRAAIPRLPRAS